MAYRKSSRRRTASSSRTARRAAPARARRSTARRSRRSVGPRARNTGGVLKIVIEQKGPSDPLSALGGVDQNGHPVKRETVRKARF